MDEKKNERQREAMNKEKSKERKSKGCTAAIATAILVLAKH